MDGNAARLPLHAEQIREERGREEEGGAHQQAHDRDESQGAVGRPVGLGNVAGPPMPCDEGRRPNADQPEDHPAQPADIGRQADRIGGRRADLAGKVRVVKTDEERQELFQERRQRQGKQRRMDPAGDDARRRRGRRFGN